MAGNLSDYAEKKILDHTLGVAAFTMPSTIYLALFTANPTDAGTGAEVSGGAYVRKAITFSAAASPGGTTSNSADVLFPAATTAYTVTHIGLYDALSAGNLLWHGPLTASQAVAIGNEFKMGATKLSISLD